LGWHESGSLAACEGFFIVPAKIYKQVFLILFLLLFNSQFLFSIQTKTKTGADVLFQKYLSMLIGKRVGVICNQTSVLSNGAHLVDTLLKSGVKVTALFSPEHGIRGNLPAGEKYDSAIDTKTGLVIYSLYDEGLKPKAEMLRNVDVLIFDLQDVGARFYTYSITMAYAMQVAAENGKQFIVLDRPNPIDGLDIEGPVLDTVLKSGVGIFPIPIRHGLTLGELARMIVGEKWMQNISTLDLNVITMENWKREQYYEKNGIKWIPPSPNMKTPLTAIIYPGTCLLEGTNISEGRGTEKPFEWIGAPWIDPRKLSKQLNALKIDGVFFCPIIFTPRLSLSSGHNLKYKDIECNGVYFKIINLKKFKPVYTALKVIQSIDELYPDSLKFDELFFDKLLGIKNFQNALKDKEIDKFLNYEIQKGISEYQQKRSKYIIY
jgi:uncharacterized protein YbbC (DUF1343 family)